MILISFSLTVAGLAISSALLIHYLTYYVEISGSAALSSTQLAFYCGGLLGSLFWLRVWRGGWRPAAAAARREMKAA